MDVSDPFSLSRQSDLVWIHGNVRTVDWALKRNGFDVILVGMLLISKPFHLLKKDLPVR